MLYTLQGGKACLKEDPFIKTLTRAHVPLDLIQGELEQIHHFPLWFEVTLIKSYLQYVWKSSGTHWEVAALMLFQKKSMPLCHPPSALFQRGCPISSAHSGLRCSILFLFHLLSQLQRPPMPEPWAHIMMTYIKKMKTIIFPLPPSYEFSSQYPLL